MKKGLKRISLILAASLALTATFAGCGKKEPANTDKGSATPSSTTEALKDAKLKMYLLGDKSKDFDAVFAEINKQAKKDINATVDVSLLGWGDYEQKYPLLFASGEDFDIAYTADWAFYNTQASKGGFMEITQDLLKKYAPKTAENMYPDAWNQAKVNGKVFMLPMNYKELSGYVYLVRGDLMEKYNIADIKSFADYEKYLEAVAKNEKTLIPIDVGSDFDMCFMYDRLANPKNDIEGVGPWQLMAWTLKGDNTYAIKSNLENPNFLNAVTKLKEMKDKGYWSKSAVVNKTTNKESFISGKGASAMLNLNDARGQYNTLQKSHPEWKVKVFDAQSPNPATLTAFTGNGMGIYAQSKNKERALMLLDLLRNNESYHDLFSYGIKGKHYDLTSDNKIKPSADTANYPIDGNCNWGIRNDKFWKQIEGGLPNYKDIYDNWVKTAKSSPLQFFNFNDEKVKNEVATLNNIFKTDYKALALGFTENPAADIEKLKAKMKTAGADKVYAEMQAQLVEFMKNYQK